MKFRALITAILLFAPASGFAASKEIQELQRDVALMQEDIRQLQRTFDQQITALRTMTQQTLDTATRTATSTSVLERIIGDQIKQQMGTALGPVVGVGAKVDQIGGQVSALGEAVQDLNGSMQRMQAQLTDLKNAVSAMQAPAAAPPPASTSGDVGNNGQVTGGPLLSGPAPGGNSAPPVPAEVLYQNAKRDMDGGKADLAMAEYRDFIKYYPTSDLAPNAQFYIGTVHYSRNEYEDAIKDFDAVLERYPKNNKTADAFYYKGVSLVKLGRSRDARKEFTTVIQQYPRTEAAQKARSQMRALGFNVPAAGRK